jgi:hypothetical protein
MSRAEISTCQPAQCTKCRAEIRCDEVCCDLNFGTGRAWRLRCLDCVGYGRFLTYHCSTACYWRHRRARLRKPVKPRRCKS